jgi:hypothetical protein
LFQELLFVAKIDGKSFIGRCKKTVVIIIIPGKDFASFDYKPRIKYKISLIIFYKVSSPIDSSCVLRPLK